MVNEFNLKWADILVENIGEPEDPDAPMTYHYRIHFPEHKGIDLTEGIDHMDPEIEERYIDQLIEAIHQVIYNGGLDTASEPDDNYMRYTLTAYDVDDIEIIQITWPNIGSYWDEENEEFYNIVDIILEIMYWGGRITPTDEELDEMIDKYL